MNLTFRWSVWNETEPLLEMLARSVYSFKKFFTNAEFIVVAQHPEKIRVNAQVIPHGNIFTTTELDPHTQGIALFNKYNPLRVTKEGHEIYIDSDIFCIKEPTSLYEFLADSRYKILMQTRTEGDLNDRRGFGRWNHLIDPRVPVCSAGILGMKNGFNFQNRLINAYKRNLLFDDNYFNEQGSVTHTVQHEILSNQAMLISEKHIRYFHPISYPLDLNNLDTEMIHCIGSKHTNYECFSKLKSHGLI